MRQSASLYPGIRQYSKFVVKWIGLILNIDWSDWVSLVKMKHKIKAIQKLLLIFGLSISLVLMAFIGRAELPSKQTLHSETISVFSQYPNPEQELPENSGLSFQNALGSESDRAELLKNDQPKYKIARAHPTNYGERFTQDLNSVPVINQPIVVLHETAASASSAINFLQTAHTDESKQASYHTLIERDGTIVYTVPPEKRAFGAGNSIFDGPNGPETVKTNPRFPASVNNFAYHTSLETPSDGWSNNHQTHSGYTESQYHALAWLIARCNVPNERITTHRAVDRSGQRIDPRSFDFPKFFSLLEAYRQANTNH
jgi:N-acetylmuramoyl-L-alanine amidase